MLLNQKRKLTEVLGVKRGDVISLTGAGGKTSCLYRLGEEWCGQKVLLTTTTKMFYPSLEMVEQIVSEEMWRCGEPNIRPGRTFIYGGLTKERKCTAISPSLLASLTADYDLTVVEADGSKGLPLKGYREDEPCIPDCAGMNVGVVTPAALGRRVNETEILRSRRFCEMTGVNLHTMTDAGCVARWIVHPEGMFRGSRGRKILFWNQVESAEQAFLVEQVMEQSDDITLKDFERVVTGSVKNGTYRVLYERGEKV